MIKKSIPLFFLLLFSACSHEQSKLNFQTKDYEHKQKTNNPIAKAQARLCKGSVFFIPYGDTSVNFEGITEDTIKGGKIQIKGLKDIDLSGSVDIRIEYSKYIIGSKKCIIIEGEMISPKLNKISNEKRLENDNNDDNYQDDSDQKSDNKRSKRSKSNQNKY
jgi:hypothetical protein